MYFGTERIGRQPVQRVAVSREGEVGGQDERGVGLGAQRERHGTERVVRVGDELRAESSSSLFLRRRRRRRRCGAHRHPLVRHGLPHGVRVFARDVVANEALEARGVERLVEFAQSARSRDEQGLEPDEPVARGDNAFPDPRHAIGVDEDHARVRVGGGAEQLLGVDVPRGTRRRGPEQQVSGAKVRVRKGGVATECRGREVLARKQRNNDGDGAGDENYGDGDGGCTTTASRHLVFIQILVDVFIHTNAGECKHNNFLRRR